MTRCLGKFFLFCLLDLLKGVGCTSRGILGLIYAIITFLPLT